MIKKITTTMIVVTAIIMLSGGMTANATSYGITHGKDTSTPHYMGMASLNISPWPFLLPLIPGGTLHTSHGAYFPEQGIYTGASAEILYSFYGTVAISSHTRYFYPTSVYKRTQGYVGLEAGVGCCYSFLPIHSDSFFFNAALEVGMVVNFRKVSLDLGIRALYTPPFVIDVFLLPFKIGLIF